MELSVPGTCQQTGKYNGTHNTIFPRIICNGSENKFMFCAILAHFSVTYSLFQSGARTGLECIALLLTSCLCDLEKLAKPL